MYRQRRRGGLMVWGLIIMGIAWGGATSGARAATPPPARGLQEVTVGQLQEAVRAYLAPRLDEQVKTFTVRVGHPRAALKVPAGTVELEVSLSRPNGRMAKQPYLVVIRVDGAVAQQIYVVADVEAFVEGVVATKALRGGDMIGPGDVTLGQVNVLDLEGPVLTLEEVRGRRVAQMIRAQSPVQAAQLAAPHMIQKGERVTIEARRGGLTIAAAGVAKGAGGVGQTIAVMNADSGKEVSARVMGPSRVEVLF